MRLEIGKGGIARDLMGRFRAFRVYSTYVRKPLKGFAQGKAKKKRFYIMIKDTIIIY
jgi:hypothetical protein